MISNKHKFVAGPWVGEFGFEVMCWQPFVRAYQKKHGINNMVCRTRTGRDVLYSDFAEVEYFNPPGVPVSWGCATSNREPYPLTDLDPRTFKGGWAEPRGEFIKFGSFSPEKRYDVLIHARARRHRSECNWSQETWDELMGMGLGKVACIGSERRALCLRGCADLRGIPLSDLVNYMASSTLIVGPSSGPMHLATLCGCPQVVWSNNKGTLGRYTWLWNPFSVKVATALSLNPSAEKVIEMIESL